MFGPNRISPLDSLMVRSMASICALVLLIGAISVNLRAADIRKHSYRELLESAAYLSQTLAESFGLGLGENKEFMELQLKSLSSSRDFCGAKVVDAQGVAIVDEKYPAVITPDETLQDQFIVDPRAAPEDRQVLGRLWLCTRTDSVQRKVDADVRHEIRWFTVVLCGVLLAVYASLLLFIGPLMTITGKMGEVASKMKPVLEPGLLKKNEIGVLARGFNSMVADLAETYSALDAAREQAIQSELSKSAFLANMSHELRTPLNNIIGAAQLLHDRPLAEQDRDLFSIIEKSSRSLLAIVNDILDLSKIEAGEVKLERIPFDAYEKIRDTAQMFLPQGSAKGIVISAETDAKSLVILGDPLRLERVLTNLVANALRYTEKGSIRIAARAAKDAEGAATLRCEVVDTGIGIPKDRQARIFERFTQADNSTSRRFGGTGLGLTITREIINLMKGKIGVDSEPGKGSTFWFEIPVDLTDAAAEAAPAEAETAAAENAIPAFKANILVAEDHELNRAFMRRLFERLGVGRYAFAENGKIALEEAGKGGYDVVLMDCHMPEMDGYTATAAIRALPHPDISAVPIVAMTANATREDEERCLAAGMNAYISKPFEIGTFKRVLSQWVRFDVQPEEPKAVNADAPAALDILRESSGGDEAYLREMTALFAETAEKLLAEMKAAGGNAKAWAEAAHGLRGAAGIVGAARLRELATQAQRMEYAPGPAATAAREAVEAEYAVVKKFLQDSKLL